MWLKKDHDPSAARAELRCRKRRPDLCRMVTVVINDEHATGFAFRLEATACASERVQTLNNLFKRHFQLESNRNRGQCVINVMHSRHAQDHFTHHTRTAPYHERRSEVVVVADSVSGDISLG